MRFFDQIHCDFRTEDLPIVNKLIQLFAFPHFVLLKPCFNFLKTAWLLEVKIIQIPYLALLRLIPLDRNDLLIKLALVNKS